MERRFREKNSRFSPLFSGILFRITFHFEAVTASCPLHSLVRRSFLQKASSFLSAASPGQDWTHTNIRWRNSGPRQLAVRVRASDQLKVNIKQTASCITIRRKRQSDQRRKRCTIKSQSEERDPVTFVHSVSRRFSFLCFSFCGFLFLDPSLFSEKNVTSKFLVPDSVIELRSSD